MDRKNYLIYPAVTSWNEPPRARHQVANELKLDGDVYFVEKNKVGFPRVEVNQVEEHVYTITPYYWLNYKIRYRTPLINEIYHHWLLKNITRLQIPFEIIFCFDFTAPAIHRYFNNVVFYSVDDNVGFGNFNPWFINIYHSRTERLVAEGAKLCVVTSDYMGKKIGAYNNNTHVVPLGAPPVGEVHIFSPRKSKPLPVLALVGYLDSNLDFPLLKSLLQKFHIIFIGPASKANIEWISKYPNATLVGTKTGKALFDAIGEADVCIAPYDETKLNKGATPNKLWLYLSTGKPAVVSNIPNIRNWQFEQGTVYKCDNEDFDEACIKAFEEDTIELSQKRVQLAKDNSWAKRVEKVKQLFYIS